MKRIEALTCLAVIIVVAITVFNWKGSNEYAHGDDRAGDFIYTVMPERAEPERDREPVKPVEPSITPTTLKC